MMCTVGELKRAPRLGLILLVRLYQVSLSQ